jgi:hypothetical protein
MSELEDKLNSLLSNPQLMQQIMAMAQNINTPTQQETSASQEFTPEIDMNIVKQLSGIAQKGNIDKNQQTLLKALSPYLSPGRIGKLEKAMRAAKMAQFATVFLNSSQFQSGR